MAKILVIDDSAFMRNFLHELLEEAGFEVEEFVPLSALEILDKIKGSPFRLVLTDLNMPNVDGQSVARMTKKANPSIPIVVLTAIHDPIREETLVKLGVNRILYKPTDGKSVLRTIRELVS